jgi:glycerol-3-phosphate acyltransferase PlsX
LDDYDVIVCDGFVGNVALKTCEGVAKLIRHFMQQEFKRSLLTRLAALVAMPVLRKLGQRIDPRRYNGASLLGLQGIVIKSHGGADAIAFANAIQIAILEVEKAVPQRIHALLEESHKKREVL